MFRPSVTFFIGVYLMGFITWAESQDPAYQAGTAIGSAIQAAGSFYCDMIRRYPNWTLQNPLGLDPISRAINDKLCGSSPALPAPDAPAVPGGKCACIQYDVTYTGKLPQSSQFTGTDRVFGPITVYSWQSNANNLLKFGYFYFLQDCVTRTELNVVDNVSAQDIANGSCFARIDSIVRVDGNPDNCGGQLPNYIPKAPTLPDVNRTAPIVIAPGITVVTPIIIVRPTANITLAPRVNINFNPTFNLPDIGIAIKFDIAGIEINNNVNFNIGNPSFPPDPRNPPPTLPPSQGTDTDLTDLYERLRIIKLLNDEIKACACKVPPTLSTVNIGTANSGNVNLPPKTRFVVTTITQSPQSYKFQSGINAADVIYAGWAWTQ